MDKADLLLFLQIAQQPSLSAVARAARLSVGVVSHRLAAFEARLGVRLFHRSTRKLALTEDGRAFLPHAEALVEGIATARAALGGPGQPLTGTLRVTTMQLAEAGAGLIGPGVTRVAVAAGANVVVTSSSDAKLERARGLGATASINYGKSPGWGEEARRLTGGRGADHALDVGGPSTLNEAFTAARTGGAVSVIGVLTGFSGEIQTAAILQKALRVRGIYVGSVAMFEAMVRAIDAHQIKPVIDRVFAFDEAPAAYDYLASGQHFGKVVIRG